MREDWAKAWARHMKPGGKLITLIFPVEPEPRDDGPPWYVHPDMYTQMLTANGTRTCLQPSVWSLSTRFQQLSNWGESRF
jgi:hypothetical protein